MNYRAEIDGLRAIAVLSVILYHAQIDIFGRDRFTGGFIGVDIFFCISGYLITRIILSELFEKSSFNFLQFYERRVRRILPMLFTVMLLSFPFAFLLLWPADFIEYSQSILSAVFFGSNFFFYSATTTYGADSALLKPFLHTWSLGIEEQFYIVFPILLAISYKLKNHVLTLFLGMLLLSLQFANELGRINAELNFYLPFSRFWVLLVGSLLAYLELKYGQIKKELLSNIFPIIGLFLITHAILFFDDKTPHPSFETLIPIVGVALVIAFSSTEDLVGKVLGSKPFMGIGLISYSAYLWHFPIFAFSRISKSTPSNYDKVEWIGLTFVLSVISYFLIEKPFRNKQLITQRLMWCAVCVFAVVVVSLSGYSITKNGFEERLPPILLKSYLSVDTYKKFKQDGEICFNRRDNYCSFKNAASSLKVLALGDSQLSSLSPNLFSRIKNDFTYSEANIGGCPFVLGVNRFSAQGALEQACTNERQKDRSKLIGHEPSILILGGRIPLYLTSQYFDDKEGALESPDMLQWSSFISDDGGSFENKLIETIHYLLKLGHHIIYVYPIPEIGVNLPKHLKGSLPFYSIPYFKIHHYTTSFDTYIERTKLSFTLLNSIEHPNFHRVFPHKLFCDNQVKSRCVTHDEDVFYGDSSHPSKRGAEMINDLIIEKLYLIKSAVDNGKVPLSVKIEKTLAPLQ